MPLCFSNRRRQITISLLIMMALIFPRARFSDHGHVDRTSWSTKLMLFGTVLTLVLLGVPGSICNFATQILSAVFLFIFNSFAIGRLGMTWLCVILRPLRPTL